MRIFISYSHNDEAIKDRLVKHLRVLQFENIVQDVWDDSRIAAGADWRANISDAMMSADVGVLLISVDFLTSRYIREQEVPELLKGRVFPIIARACPWQEVGWLQQLQVRPKNGKPLPGGKKMDEALANIAMELARFAKASPGTASSNAVHAVPDKSDEPAAAFPRQDRAPVPPVPRRKPGAAVHAVAEELRDIPAIFVTSVLAREKALEAYDLADPRTLSLAFRILIYVSLATAILHIPAWHESRIRYGHPVFIPLAAAEEMFEQIAFAVLLYAAARMFGGTADHRQFFSAFGLLGAYLLMSNACLARFQLTAIKVGVAECSAELADIGKGQPGDLAVMLVAAIASIAFRIVLARSLLRAFPVAAQPRKIKTAMTVVVAIGMWMISVTVVFQPLECMLYRAFGP